MSTLTQHRCVGAGRSCSWMCDLECPWRTTGDTSGRSVVTTCAAASLCLHSSKPFISTNNRNKQTICHSFYCTTRRYHGICYSPSVCLSVCLSVCTSHAHTALKRLNTSSFTQPISSSEVKYIPQDRFGTAMGSPVSPMVADIYMEQMAIVTVPLEYKPRLWTKYVDDIVEIINKDAVKGLTYRAFEPSRPNGQHKVHLRNRSG